MTITVQGDEAARAEWRAAVEAKDRVALLRAAFALERADGAVAALRAWLESAFAEAYRAAFASEMDGKLTVPMLVAPIANAMTFGWSWARRRAVRVVTVRDEHGAIVVGLMWGRDAYEGDTPALLNMLLRRPDDVFRRRLSPELAHRFVLVVGEERAP